MNCICGTVFRVARGTSFSWTEVGVAKKRSVRLAVLSVVVVSVSVVVVVRVVRYFGTSMWRERFWAESSTMS